MVSIVDTLRRAINPRTVAVVGASNDPAKFGGRVMRFLQKHGYAGKIVPVHPTARSILELPAFEAPADAGVAIDVALLAVPAAHLPQALEQCGAAKIPCCVVITADFAELGEEGAAREADLVRIARAFDMRLVGPNCLGFINPHLRLALTSSVALAVEPMPKGAIGLVSQSGSMMASMISRAQDTGAGFSACVTVGNQADLETCDFLEYFVADPTTSPICTYIEGLKDGRRFLALAERCRAAGKPLLALKAGSSKAGSAIARSHTASLAGSHAVWEAACRDFGVLAVDDPESMIDCAHFLSRFGGASTAGVAALSPSGGTIAVTADRLAAARLELAPLEERTRRALRRLVPAPRPLNPLDVGGLPRERGVSAATEAQTLLSADPGVGVVLIVVATTPQLDDKVRQWGEAAIASRKPTAILFTPGGLVDGARRILRDLGCPFTDRMDDALRVIRTCVEYGRILSQPAEVARAPRYAEDIERALRSLAPGPLSEIEAKALLRTARIEAPHDAFATSADAAVEAAERIGYPVVLKAVCRDLVHKSDIGAVRLALSNSRAVVEAWHDIESALARHLPRSRFEGCSVQQMASGGTEVIIGTRWDPQFGAVVLAGAGGILVEIVRDVALALAPLTHARARAMLERLQVWPILTGARGRPPADVDALGDALVRLSWIAHIAGRALLELEVNPLLVRSTGVIALDGRGTVTGQ